MKVVLDTNVWLDWLVFEGNEVAGLRQAFQARTLRPVIDEACLEELRRVLAYPEFGLDPAGVERRVGEVVALCESHKETAPHDAPSRNAVLPRCKDRDDQKFLALAMATSAITLFTRDKALLSLARRARRRCGFDIVEPRCWSPQP